MTVPRVPTCGIGRDVSDQVGVREKTSESVGTRLPFRWGKRRTQQIPFVVNNNRADIKITVAIPRDRRPPITPPLFQINKTRMNENKNFRVLPILVHDGRSSIIASTSPRNLLNCKKIKKNFVSQGNHISNETTNKTWPFVTADEDSKHQPSTPLTSHIIKYEFKKNYKQFPKFLPNSVREKTN
ncbi:hypothetical protein TNCV_1341711 [Trichonephila clavipes]|uniref:Uncharacterized protein n=1 Tax=Trichonephila clavipes TaxID=2585209 RepID=A0A8X6RVU5_TRICX|nr:hypothetical protein TNCV_1341711 [Trichonephila clavipes]